MAYRPYSTEALLRALSAPPSLGDFSATQAVNYLSPGIGVGPGGQMVMKDQAGIDAAARRMQAEMDRARAANPYAGLVFGDSIGQAQGQALNLRAQRVAEAQNAARLAMAQQAQILDAEARRQAQALNEAYRRDALAQNAQTRQDALDVQERASQRQYLANLASRVQAPSTGQPALDVQALLQNQAGVRGQLAGVETGMANVYQDMLDAARAEAAWQTQRLAMLENPSNPSLGSPVAFTVEPGSANDPRPQVNPIGTPRSAEELARSLAAIQTAMRSYVPASSWDPNTPLPDLTGTGGEYIPGGIDREAILRELAARQTTGQQNLATLQDVFRARGALNAGAGSGSGTGTARGGNLTPEMFLQLAQLGLQPAAQAPTPVGPMVRQAVPLTLLDRAWGMGPSNAPMTDAERSAQNVWYLSNPEVARLSRSWVAPEQTAAPAPAGYVNPAPDSAGVQALLAQLAQSMVPPQAPSPEPVTAQYRMQGGNLVPVGLPTLPTDPSRMVTLSRQGAAEPVVPQTLSQRGASLQGEVPQDVLGDLGKTYPPVVVRLVEEAARAGMKGSDVKLFMSEFETAKARIKNPPTVATRLAEEAARAGMKPSDVKLFMSEFETAKDRIKNPPTVATRLAEEAARAGMKPSDVKLFMSAFEEARKRTKK